MNAPAQAVMNEASSAMPSQHKKQKARFRPGEELDVVAVERWLRAQGVDVQGSADVTQYSGGASNWTYRLRYADRSLVLRRPPSGTKAKSAHDMAREYSVQRALRARFPYVPKMVAHCADDSVIGSEFYLMEHLEGTIPRKELGFELSPSDTARLCSSVLDVLIALHDVPLDSPELATLDRGPGYCRRQIEGWSERYQNARTWNVPSFAYIRAWLLERIPTDAQHCLIHNDFRFDNVVLDKDNPTRVLGLLDWEMATVGDPLMDLGNTLAYWVESKDDAFARMTRRQPTHLPGMLTRREVVEYYLSRRNLGFRADDFVFYEVYGLFRLAVIVQQIYFRYHHGQSQNRSHSSYWTFVHYLNLRCRKLISMSKR